MKQAPAFRALVFLMTGMGLFRWISPSPGTSLALMSGITLVWWFAQTRGKPLGRVFSLAAVVVLGLFRITLSERDVSPGDVARLADSLFCRIEGAVLADPVISSHDVSFPLSARRVWTGDTLLFSQGRVWVKIRPVPPEPLQAGDRIWVTGLLFHPPGRWNPAGFDQRAFLARQGIHRILKSGALERIERGKGHTLFSRFLSPLRRQMTRRIHWLYPETSRGLIRTLLLADRTGLEEDVHEAFARMGVVHLLAVSGLHVGFILLFLQVLLGFFPLSRPMRSFVLLCGLAGFAGLTGAKPPVLRAILMVGLYRIGLEMGRKVHPLQTTAAVAFFLLLFRPAYLGDLGFLLSFSAVFSMILLTPPLSELAARVGWINRLKGHSFGSATISLFLVSLAAQLGTLPIVLYHFYRFSLAGFLFNLVAIPLSGLIVYFGWTSVLLSFLFMPAGEAMAAFNHLLVQFLIRMTTLCASLPGVSFWVGRPSPLWFFLYGTALLMLLSQKQAARKRLIFLFLGLWNLTVWLPVFREKPPRLLYYQLDVGQGDAALIRLPDRKVLLIDGGPMSESFDAGEKVILPLLRQWGCSRIDRVVLTHPHADHVGGLVTLTEHLSIGQVLLAGSTGGDSIYGVFLQSLKRKGIPLRIVSAPDSLLFPGVRIDFLSPDSAFKRMASVNDQSLVALLTYGRIRFLLMGDAEERVEERLLRRCRRLQADVLKVGHHGARRAATKVFLDSLAARHAILSVGRNNRHGHPSKETLQRLRAAGISFLRTDHDGAIRILTDGKTLWMTSERAFWKKSPTERGKRPSRLSVGHRTRTPSSIPP